MGVVAAGAVLLIPALVILLQAAAAALIDQGFQPYVATLIVGGAAFLVGLMLALTGMKQLKMKKLTPHRPSSSCRATQPLLATR